MEFVEVFKQAQRLCKCFDYKCLDCPLGINDGCSLPPWKGIAGDEIERRVMEWAKEHPEPQYPTWKEWLIDQDIISVEYIASAPSTTPFSAQLVQAVRTQPEFYRPIPADIAEKLGLEPKEVNGNDTRPR